MSALSLLEFVARHPVNQGRQPQEFTDMCVNVGIGSAPGTLRFSSGMDTGNRTRAEGEQRAGGVDVPATTLDALLAGRSPRLIQVDVNGYEPTVLAGVGATLRDRALQAVITEVSGSGDKYGFSESKLFETTFVRDIDAVQRRLRDAGPFSVNGKRF